MYFALPVDIMSSRDSDISVSWLKILDILDKTLRSKHSEIKLYAKRLLKF